MLLLFILRKILSILRKRMSKLKSLKLYLSLTSLVFTAALLTGCGGDTADPSAPQVVSAISISNTEVLVQFSKTVVGGIDGAENPASYSIATAASSNSVGPDGEDNATTGGTATEGQTTRLPVLAAVFSNRYSTTVLLTTASQTSTKYKVTVINIRDEFGTTIAAPTIAVDPSSTTFVGSDPGSAENVDSDGDSLPDHVEVLGWTVAIKRTNGDINSRMVTSSPYEKDTDGDGVTDDEELHGSMDPRSADTDGDKLSDNDEWNTIFSDPTAMDTDGDGVQDGFEYLTFRTSPILADTDGDQISDPDEVFAGNRNPLIADLPSPRIRIGNVNLQLNTLFSFTSEQSESVTEAKTVEATLTRGEDETYATSDVNSTKSTLGSSQDINNKASVSFPALSGSVELERNVGFAQGSEKGSTFTTDEGSTRKSEDAYRDSLTTETTRDESETITREITSAAVKVDVSIESTNDIPFTISNLELTAQTQDPLNRRRIIPVASLVPENNLSKLTVNVGALGDPSRGPFVFKTVDVFPQQVQELMKSPQGLIIQLANFDITDEMGRNFAFTSRDVLDRTAGIAFDFGDGRTESYRVASASAHDPANGKPLGISMEYALSIIGMQRYQYILDGGNGIFESQVDDADNDLIGKPGASVEPGRILITAGADGILQSTPEVGGDDFIEEPDYETEFKEFRAYIRDGGNGLVETLAESSDQQETAVPDLTGSSDLLRVTPGSVIVTAGSDGTLETTPKYLDLVGITRGDDKVVPAEPGRRMLVRLRDVSQKPGEKRFWVFFTDKSRSGVDLDDLVIRAGEQYDFAFVQDQDGDGVWAREEYLYGSSDLRINTDSCLTSLEDRDFGDNCDSLDDKLEIQDGWKVNIAGSPEFKQVYPNPNQGDSDRDRLFDDQELACVLDPRQRDTDLDGLSDWEELTGMRLVPGDAEPRQMVSIDPNTGVEVYQISPYSGESGIADIVDHIAIEACSDAVGVDGFATNPLNSDTDGDFIDDELELQLGLNPNDKSDGPLFLDDDGDGVPNKLEEEGYEITVNTSGQPETYRVYSNKYDPDTDDDGLPDLLERMLGSNPSYGFVDHCNNGLVCEESGTDTDGDGISDLDEYANGGVACVTRPVGEVCVKFNSIATDGWQDFVRKCDFAKICDATSIATYVADFSREYGTNLNESDSDFDNVKDPDEMKSGLILVEDSNVILPTLHASGWISDPLLANSDEDDWNDGVELARKTDPRKRDTDGDGTDDHVETGRGRNPVYADKRVTIRSRGFNVTKTDDEGTDNTIELVWFAKVSRDSGEFGSQVCNYNSIDGGLRADNPTFLSKTCEYGSHILRENASSKFKVIMSGWEDDYVGEDNIDDDQCDPVTLTWIYTDADDEKTASFECEPGADSDLNFNLTLETTVD
jgi:hypothetical protein